MLAITEEWIEKAEEDWSVAQFTLAATHLHAYNTICFHAQQCTEKYLKARLQEDAITPAKTHDLEKLLDLLLPTFPLWTALRPALAQLTDYAVDFRYPGETAELNEAQEAVKLCRDVRATVRGSLSLPF